MATQLFYTIHDNLIILNETFLVLSLMALLLKRNVRMFGS